jgi:hypothetical protein
MAPRASGSPAKVKVRNLLNGLLPRDVHRASGEFHNVLNSSTISVGERAHAYDSDSECANLDRQVFSETFNRAECCANEVSNPYAAL